ncbi:hypothetical protein [Lichenihabitans sp. Uapishka_5]|uniref:hypothetical protein n=1 Tax=Lichenihabitans sp. Uapishka_5 TaxID=3037302 RepID=UPI0029E80358|nr:hypothetical protein [Lichenihabitans sp. Uapishka_5]
MIERQQNERIQSMAESIVQLCGTVEALTAAVFKTREEMMIRRVRCSEKESRLVPAHPSERPLQCPQPGRRLHRRPG